MQQKYMEVMKIQFRTYMVPIHVSHILEEFYNVVEEVEVVREALDVRVGRAAEERHPEVAVTTHL